MTERVVEYLANALWQLPLLAAGAWCLLRTVKFGVLVQHRVWVAVLGLGVMLPLARVEPQTVVVRPMVTHSAVPVSTATGEMQTMVEVPLRERAEKDRLGWLRQPLRRRSVEVSAGLARGIAGAYLALMLLGLVRIVRSWRAARRLVASAEDVALGEGLRSMLVECGQRMGVGLPQLAVSGEVSSPAVVGSVLLLPAAFLEYSDAEMRAALLHELAHLRRGDYGANLLCEMAALPVVWHPASSVMRSRIQSTREMVCDELAAETMGSAKAYALSLAGLAAKAFVSSMEARPMAVGLFTNNNLEERVMRLMETKQAMGVRAKLVHSVGAAFGMLAVLFLAGMLHVTPAMGQVTTSAAPQATAVPEVPPAPPALPAADAIPAPPQPPALPALPTGPSSVPLPSPKSFASGQSLSMEDEPVSAVSVYGKGTATGQSSSDGASNSGAGSLSAGLTGASVLGDLEKDCPTVHGTNTHRWLTSQGKDFWLVNCDAKEPTAEQKKWMEKKFLEQMGGLQRQMAELSTEHLSLNGPLVKKQMEDAQKELLRATTKMNSPEFQKQMKELEVSKIDRLASQKQLLTRSTAEMQQRMAELQTQLPDAGLDKLHAQLEIKQPDSAEMKRQMVEIDRQISKLTSKEVQMQIEEEMKTARKQIEDAQKLMEAERLRMKEHPEACTGDCTLMPQ